MRVVITVLIQIEARPVQDTSIMVFVIIPIGLITSCLRSASRDRDEREVQYVQVQPRQQVVMVHHHQRQMCVRNGAYYPAGPHPGSSPHQPPPYCVATNGHPQSQHQQAGQPKQAQQQASAAQANSEGSRRRKPWQRRSKDGYSYTVLES